MASIDQAGASDELRARQALYTETAACSAPDCVDAMSNRYKRGVRFAIGLWLIVWAVTSAAQPVGEERLLITTPDGWTMVDQQAKGAQLTTELVPSDQSPIEWRDRLSIQVFAQKPVQSPEAFQQALTAHWRQSCPHAESAPVSSGHENSYAFGLWMLACRQRPDSDGPIFAWFKAIEGRDAFYLVQRSFAYAPKKTRRAALDAISAQRSAVRLTAA